LKITTETQEFKQKIKGLKKGANTFQRTLVDKPQAGQYTLSIEILNEELKVEKINWAPDRGLGFSPFASSFAKAMED
jgi:hypothetical protein